ncbi:hypothetical protein ACIBQ1_10030 [Nonomuraea sp. NPDC050153]|uniref:hypothetical protein n=1 Tax=Nonomuraea sp. NPDC050153 TaxID=3364359 RepID=UPI00379F3B80
MTDSERTITMTAAELEMRHNGGNRFRLRAMLYMEPSEPPQVGGQWPIITEVCDTGTKLRPPILYSTQASPGEAYEARRGDKVRVIPVHPHAAARGRRERTSAHA